MPMDEFAVMVAAPSSVKLSVYDSSTSPAKGFTTFGGSATSCSRVIDVTSFLLSVDGSKSELRGWNFHGTKFFSKIVLYVLWIANWTICDVSGAPLVVFPP